MPTDFSEPSFLAARLAAQLARTVGARLILLHVMDRLFYNDPDPYPHDIDQQQEAEARKGLEQLLSPEETAGIDVERAVRSQDPFQGILSVAEGRGVDLIVLGTHGRRGLSRLFLGSVAERVVRLAPSPGPPLQSAFLKSTHTSRLLSQIIAGHAGKYRGRRYGFTETCWMCGGARVN